MVATEIVTDWFPLRVEDRYNPHNNFAWWIKFMQDCGFLDSEKSIDFYLAPFNGRNINDSDYIEFKTEADLMVFVLKYAT
jgi:hypothetical protein